MLDLRSFVCSRLIALPFLVAVVSCNALAQDGASESITEGFSPKTYPEKYQADWESLAKHPHTPDWLADGKLGIYFHWGPYCVPAFRNEWYPRFMHLDNPPNWGRGAKEYHEKTFGPVSEFGYHHFIPKFTGEHFDPKEWAVLFKAAGATFAGPVAQHHDGFSMWASRVNPNNSVVEGPKRDITGELFAELKKNNLRTIATFHHSFTGQREREGQKGDRAMSYYPYSKDYFTSSEDPKLRKLYGNLSEQEFNDYWLSLVQEVVDTYAPDIIWFDSWLDVIPEEYRKRMAAHHFNAAASRDQSVALICKQEDLPEDVRLLDIEQGGMKDLPEKVWMTDITLSTGGWCHVQGQKYKPLPLLVRNMVDVWAKRGVVLLNISPRADGVIVDEQRDRLRGLGDWLDVYGEAVYATVPHTVYGYGDAAIKDGSHGGQSATIKYSASDIRFTRSKDGDVIYVFLLGQPKTGTELAIKHIAGKNANGREVQSVSQMGSDAPCEWSVDGDLLKIQAPKATAINELTTVFKVEF